MRLATYNVESFFERPKAMNLAAADPTDRWAEGRDILTDCATFNALVANSKYSDQDKSNILALIKKLRLTKEDESKYVILRQNHGHLIKRPKNGPVEVVAGGRGDWVGWLDLVKGDVEETAVLNTARVISDAKADIQVVVEAENRKALCDLSDILLPKVGGKSFAHSMLVDGNDDRGIDVGIMVGVGYSIASIKSHVDDTDGDGQVFSRDCPEYEVKTPSGTSIWVLPNHFKSKGYGVQSDSDKKRLRQATRVKEIYQSMRADGKNLIAILGDFNDTPDSATLEPLLKTDLKDIFTHPDFDNGGRPGTIDNCTKGDKFDYILLSPELYGKVNSGGVFRKGVWGGTHGDMWEIYKDTMKKPSDAASDHAAVWAEIDIQ